jgi:hypothetical protein
MNERQAATSTATVVMIATLATRAWKGGLFRSRISALDIVNVRGITAPHHPYTCPFLTLRFLAPHFWHGLVVRFHS